MEEPDHAIADLAEPVTPVLPVVFAVTRPQQLALKRACAPQTAPFGVISYEAVAPAWASEAFRSAWIATVAAVDLWDDVHWDILSQRHLDVVGQTGALSLLPLALASRAIFDIHSGNLAAAAGLVAEPLGSRGDRR